MLDSFKSNRTTKKVDSFKDGPFHSVQLNGQL